MGVCSFVMVSSGDTGGSRPFQGRTADCTPWLSAVRQDREVPMACEKQKCQQREDAARALFGLNMNYIKSGCSLSTPEKN